MQSTSLKSAVQPAASHHTPDNFPMPENAQRNPQVFHFNQKVMIALDYKDKDQIRDKQAKNRRLPSYSESIRLLKISTLGFPHLSWLKYNLHSWNTFHWEKLVYNSASFKCFYIGRTLYWCPVLQKQNQALHCVYSPGYSICKVLTKLKVGFNFYFIKAKGAKQ